MTDIPPPAGNEDSTVAPTVLPPFFAYRFEPGAPVRTLETDVEGPAPAGGFRWITVRHDSADLPARLAGWGVDPVGVQALYDEETRPRCSILEHGAVIIMRGVNLNPGAEPHDMISIRLWVEPNQVIAVWRRPLRAVADLKGAVDRGSLPQTPGDLVARLALRLADRAEPIVARLNEDIDRLEEGEEEIATAAMRTELSQLRRIAIGMRRYMLPQRDALTTIDIEDFSWLTADDHMLLREAANRVTRLTEELETLRERAAIMHDEIMNRQSEEMNRRMFTLSIVATVFLPLSLISGLLGMNVGGVPLEKNELGFALVTAAICLVGVVQYWLMRERKLF